MTPQVYAPRAFFDLAVNHIIDTPRCALFAGCGTGKTSLVESALDRLFLSGAESRPALILGPLRVARKTWSAEAGRWVHLRDISVSQIVGTPAQRQAALRRDASIYTINYEMLPWLIDHLGNSWPFGTVVPDEATRLKGFRLRQGGQRARALAGVAHKKTRRWINLTGTPAAEGLKDTWGHTWFLDEGVRLGRTYDAFMNRWFQASFDGYGVKPLPYAQVEIQDRLRDICLTIDAKDYWDIKDPIVRPVYVDLPPKARGIYDEMQKKMFAEIAGNPIEAFNAASRTNKCLQLANGAVYIGDDDGSDSRPFAEVHTEKIQVLESIIEEACGMPIIVGYNFKSDLARLKAAFPTGRHLHSAEDEEDFIAGKIPILFAHPKSAGHGIDGFQYVTNIIALFGHNWSLEEYIQLIERIGPVRQFQAGLDRPVFVYPIIARDTVDELVMARRESKRSVQDLLLEAMKRAA